MRWLGLGESEGGELDCTSAKMVRILRACCNLRVALGLHDVTWLLSRHSASTTCQRRLLLTPLDEIVGRQHRVAFLYALWYYASDYHLCTSGL